MNALIAAIEKNSLDAIRIALIEYKGKQYVDIRTYTQVDREPEPIPTKKGLTIAPALLPELIAALQQAHQQLGGDHG